MAEPRAPSSSNCCRSFPTCVVLLLIAAASLVHPSAAETYELIFDVNTPGGIRFNREFTDVFDLLKNATADIQGAFSLSTPKDIAIVTLRVESFAGVAQTAGSTIQLSSEYVASQFPNDAAAMRFEITGVLYHEMTHVWQNNNGSYGTDQFFTGTIEGIADWVRLRAGFPSAGWGPRARGGNWFDGYTTTAYFLDWIDTTQKPNFVNELNLKMLQSWSNDFFLQLVGRGVDELWIDYQSSI